MWIKDVFENFTDYNKISMYIFGTTCRLNCRNCFHDHTRSYANKEVNEEELADYILSNKLVKAVLFSGLNWLDQIDDLISFISIFRQKSNNDVVIYTGYTEDESFEYIKRLKKFDNIIIKFGRYVPGTEQIFDSTLGITLNSNNQYAKKIS